MPDHSKLFHHVCIPTLLLSLVLMVFRESIAGDWLFLPGQAVFPLIAASPLEPRTGLQKEIGTSRMKLDIGASAEFLEFAPSSSDRFRLGLSMFTYALTTSTEGLRLQIDAVDGFFGGYIAYAHLWPTWEGGLRFRILHRSAHFVDGHSNPTTGTWQDDREPIPYTKDFGELLSYSQVRVSCGVFQGYAGFSYSTLVRPETIERLGAMGGVSFRTSDNALSAFGKPAITYLGYHLSVEGIPEYVGTNTIEGGIKFGSWSATGIRLFLAYHDGLQVFGQYYDMRRETWSFGFCLDIR
jgi:hypothetical protein